MAPAPVCPEQLKLSHRAIGRGLNLDRRVIDKYVPSEARITSTTGSETIEHDDGDNGDHNGYDHEPLEADYTLESSILRLRQLERTCSLGAGGGAQARQDRRMCGLAKGPD
jgi:hypothetical protein